MTNGKQSCRPPKGNTYLTIGQDLFSISEYALSQYNASLHDHSNSGPPVPLSEFTPAAAMVYTDIQTLRGLKEPSDYGSGVEFADGILNSLFPGEQVGLQMGLWLNGTEGCTHINQGKFNSNIKKLVRYLSFSRASKIFLRIGYEFDNPTFGYSDDAQGYVAAYRKIAKACKQRCREKVLLVWHSWGAPVAGGLNLTDWYPGDDVVDWIGVSVFQQFYPWAVKDGQLGDIERVLDFAADREKPTMIAESTPFGGIDDDMSDDKFERYNLTNPWFRWYQPVLDLIDRYDISMWSYINCDWNSQPMWRFSGFGETRLSANTNVMDQWRQHVLGKSNNKRTFLLAGSLVECGKRGNGQFHSVSFGLPRDLIQPHTSRRSIKDEEWKVYTTASCAALLSVLAALFVWRRRRMGDWEETLSIRGSDRGYGSLDFRTQSLESLPSSIPTHSIRVRARGGIRWRDPLSDFD